ncbi:MAG: aminopeptidase P family protein [Candidatus Tectomicrobia bacterium]|nr:aminopeptidase P family protein [Candidatus Tectomicrobia bacterium]
MKNSNIEPRDPAFTEQEHRERLTRAKEVLKRTGLDCCICVAPELLYYFAGYEAHTHFSIQALVFGPNDDEPTLVIRDVDRGRVEVTSWVADVRYYRHVAQDPVELVANAVREKVASPRRIALDLKTHALTGAYALRLVDLLRPAQFEDSTPIIDSLRLVKSEQEMMYIREAGRYAEVGLQRALQVIRPGLTEIELAGQIELAMREAGSEYQAMPTWMNTGPRRSGHKTPDHRAIRSGDSITMEFAGVHRRYHAVTMQTVAVGKVPASFQKTYNAALKALRVGSAMVKAGIAVAESERAAVKALIESGADPSVRARFGYGVSACYPPTWLESLDITLESEQVFQPNMSFVLHVGHRDSKTSLRVLIGGAYVLTKSGLEVLSGGDRELAVL